MAETLPLRTTHAPELHTINKYQIRSCQQLVKCTTRTWLSRDDSIDQGRHQVPKTTPTSPAELCFISPPVSTNKVFENCSTFLVYIHVKKKHNVICTPKYKLTHRLGILPLIPLFGFNHKNTQSSAEYSTHLECLTGWRRRFSTAIQPRRTPPRETHAGDLSCHEHHAQPRTWLQGRRTARMSRDEDPSMTYLARSSICTCRLGKHVACEL